MDSSRRPAKVDWVRRRCRRSVSDKEIVCETSSTPSSHLSHISCLGVGNRAWGATSGHYDDNDLRDLGQPLGMSFASLISQILDGKISSQGKIPTDYICYVCTSTVKESITNMHGERFDSFIKYFEKSFESTLKTLRKINDASISHLEYTTGKPSVFTHSGSVSTAFNSSANATTSTSSTCDHSVGSANIVGNSSAFSRSTSESTSNSTDLVRINEYVQESATINPVNDEIILHGQMNEQFAHVSHDTPYFNLRQSVLNTYERSVNEQTRSNDLRELEMSLAVDKLKLKQYHLGLQSHTNMLKEVEIKMGMRKASFEEEKQSNKIQRMRHAELSKTFGDILVTGLIIMCVMLAYGAYVFTYERIMNFTYVCPAPVVKKSWWMPKQITHIGPILQSLRCNIFAMSRMSFGVLMVLVIAYLLFKSSAASGAATPVTFIIGMLGVICGYLGQLCVGALGGDGNQWLVYWEGNCMIHLLVTLFPAAFYRILYGHGSSETRRVRPPYMIMRYMFYITMLLVYPTWSGLSPFASLDVWKEHFAKKLLG